MKNIILFLFGTCFCLFNPCTLEAKYTYQFSNDTLIVKYSVGTHTIRNGFSPYQISPLGRYSYVEIDDEHDVMCEDNYPALPCQHVPFAIPDGYTINRTGITFKTDRSRNLLLRYEYAPYLDPSMSPGDIDEKNPIHYYSKPYYELSEITTVMGQQGFWVTFNPVRYSMIDEKATMVTSITVKIPFIRSNTTYNKKYETWSREQYLNAYFVNYPIDESKNLSSEKYLMITTDFLKPILSSFAQYKRSLGFQVDIVTIENIGSSPESIKNYIKYRYDNPSNRPTYVLLVGSWNTIPVYAGDTTGSDYKNPPTDLLYTRMDSDNSSDIFLGRWPVFNERDLVNIISKTIKMEDSIAQRIPFSAVSLVDGSAYGGTLSTCHKIINKILQDKGVIVASDDESCHNIKAVREPGHIYEFLGHGSINGPRINSIDCYCEIDGYPIIFETPKIGFIFACRTGRNSTRFDFASKWMNKELSGVALFAASVNSMLNSTKAIAKKVFSTAFDKNARLALITQSGMESYANRFSSEASPKRTEIHRKSYNLFGDPSLIIGGNVTRDYIHLSGTTFFHSGLNLSYHASDFIEVSDENTIQSDASLSLSSGHKILFNDRIVLKSRSKFNLESDQIDFKQGFAVESNADINVKSVESTTISGGSYIATGSSVSIKSGQSILLKPGFLVENGVKFSASIEPVDLSFTSGVYSTSSSYSHNASENGLNSDLGENKKITSDESKFNAIIFPNPSNGSFKLHISNAEIGNYLLKIVTISGTVIYNKYYNIESNSFTIDLNLNSVIKSQDILLLSILKDSQLIYSSKVLIE